MTEAYLLKKIIELESYAAQSLRRARQCEQWLCPDTAAICRKNAATFNTGAGFYGQMLGIASLLPTPDRMAAVRAVGVEVARLAPSSRHERTAA